MANSRKQHVKRANVGLQQTPGTGGKTNGEVDVERLALSEGPKNESIR